MPPQYVSVPYGSVCQCQYSIIAAPREMNANAAWRSCPGYGGRLNSEPPIACASVSVTRKRDCFDENRRSAWRNIAATPEVVHGVTGSSCFVASRWSCMA
ncbi:hypothetical protein GCM10025877_22780 [Agromyces mangrovi Wang et al. 2018]|nr:hypothetical protein GCM10025877_22780 [Agromyces mangrovi]